MSEYTIARRLLLCAGIELWDYLMTKGGINFVSIIYQKLMPNLEFLMDENILIRKNAFATMGIYLPLEEFRLEERGNTFQDLSKYFEYCNSLHGGAASWTLVFSSEERDKLAKSQVPKCQGLDNIY